MKLKKKIIKVCLIGAGRIGFKLEFDKKRLKPASHYGMWLKNKKVILTAVAEKNKSFLLKKKINKKIKIYEDYKKMIRLEKPDVVSIATWKDSHYQITNNCINLGLKNIVLEKPLANNINQALKIHCKIKKNKIKIFVNHRRRFDKEIINLKNKIENKIIGDILHVSANYVYGILTTGTHLIDTIRMLLNKTAGEVRHVIGIKNKFNHFCPKDDCNVDGYIFFEKGVTASIQSLNMKYYDNFDIYIYGSKGLISIKGIGRDGFIYKVTKSKEHSGFDELNNKPKRLFGPKQRNQFGYLSQNVVENIANKNKSSLCDSYESLIDMLIIDKLIKSSKMNSKKIKIIIPKNLK
jgi:predicted dehydrogenase